MATVAGESAARTAAEIVVRHVPESLAPRFESLLHLVLAGGGDAGERPAVKGIEGGEDFEAAFVVAELAGELEQALVGLGAAVAEKAFAGADEIDQRLGQPPLRFVVVEIRNVDELARLLDQRLGDGRVRVAERGDGDAAAEIEVAPARHVEHVAAGAVAERDVEARVTGHDMFCRTGPARLPRRCARWAAGIG